MKTSLLTKLLVPSFALFICVVFFVGAVSQREAEQAIKNAIMRSLQSELKATQASVDSMMRTYEQDVISLARSPLLMDMLNPASPDAVRASLREALDISLRDRSLMQNGAFLCMNVLDDTGKVIASAKKANLGLDLAALPSVRKALAGEADLGFPLTDRGNSTIVPYAVPVMLGSKVAGAVQVLINFDKLAHEFVAPVTFGKLGHAFIATTDGYILYHPDTGQIMAQPASTWLTPAMVRQGMGVLRYTWRDQPWMALFETSRVTGWTTIVKVQEDEIFAPARAIRWTAFGSIAIAFVVFAAIMFVMLRHLVGSLKRVVNYAETVAGGDLSTTLDVDGNDEVGTLANSLRHMVRSLRQLMAANSARTIEAEQNRLLAEDAVQIKERFLARVSHEIRTPMNAIIGFSHLCLQSPLPPQPRAYLNNLHSAALELLKLVNELLDFSATDKDTSTERVPFSISLVIRELTAVYAADVRARGIDFTAQIGEEVPDRLVGDPLRLRQVLTCLLENAVKFTEKGFIRLAVTRIENHKDPLPRDTVPLLFEVTDSGIGMSPELIARMADGFTQADMSNTRRHGGLGLGLPLARKFVENMGGSSYVSSTLGEGSVFSFVLCLEEMSATDSRLPAVAGPEPAPCDDHSLDKALNQLNGKHILLVEDNIFNQQIAIELLQQYGLGVSVANNGQEALELFDAATIDFVLMDIQMPIMDGLESCRRLRAQGVTIPIVALTAHSSPEDREQSFLAGMNAHLTKPVNPDELLQTLLQWMPLRGNMTAAHVSDASGEKNSAPSSSSHTPTSSIMEDTIDAVLSTSKGLSHVAGNKNLYVKLLTRFLQDHTTETQKIQASLDGDDAPSACRMAHTMKSVAATLGADSLSGAAKQLELALRETPIPPRSEIDAMCSTFNTQLQRASVAIKVYLHSEGVPFTADAATAQAPQPAPATPVAQPVAPVAAAAPSPAASASMAVAPAVAAASPAASPMPASPVHVELGEDAQLSMMPGRQSILLVDDSPEQLIVLEEILGADHNVHLAASGTEALTYLEDTSRRSMKDLPDLILLDVLMPGLDGYATCQELKKLPNCKDIPIMFLTGMSDTADEARGLALGAVDYIIKPFQPELLKSRVQRQLELKHIRNNLEELVERRTQEISLTQKVTIETLATLAEYRSLETGDHIKRTQRYVQVIAEHMSKKPEYADVLTPKLLSDLELSAPLHDIGKVGIPDAILCKPGKLTFEEFEEMKKHTLYGHDALSAAETALGKQSFLSVARLIAIAHHEKWDGSGYPNKLSGESIPLVARIMAIADVYDALTTVRVYKPAYTHEQARQIILDSRGSHFDPGVVDAFLERQDAFIAVANEQRA